MRLALRLVLQFFLLGCAWVPAAAGAQDAAPAFVMPPGEPAAASKDGKVLHAYRISGDPPRIDGRLDDAAWNQAERAEGFVQWDPDNMAPLTERTVVQVAFDAGHLYVAVRCYDGDPARIMGPVTRRDESDNAASDLIGLGFDTRHDHLTGYVFVTNPAAVQNDFTFFNDESVDRDYDAVWDVRTERTADGWQAEFRIPFSQMRFGTSSGPTTVWGFGIRRDIRRKGETGEWTARPRGERGEVSRWGHLVFPEPLAPPRRVEVLPYVSARRDQDAADTDHGVNTGADLRLGLGSSAVLSATVNPDFGQVEVDPAVLNLTVFETFFPEKRPFFLEDSRTFVPPFGLFQLFHSRRIGRQPNRYLSGITGTIASRPDDTSVIGASKLTGKGSGWTYGVLTALTAREYAQVVPLDAAGRATPEDRLLEPLTSFNVARVQRNILNGTSNVGAIVTGVLREDDDDAFTGGVDYTIRWDRNRNEFNGHWALTRAPGPGGLRTGGGGVTNLSVRRKYWGTFVHASHFGRDFRVNDLGFHRYRVNSNQVNVNVRLERPDPGPRIRRAFLAVGGGGGWTDERLVIGRAVSAFGEVQFLNFWSIFAAGNRHFRVMNDLDTRGGPPIVTPAGTGLHVFVSSDSRRRSRLTVESSMDRNEEGGWGMRFGPTLRLQPSTRLQTSIGASYSFGQDTAQWIRNADADGDGVVDHIYGTLDRDVIDVTVRASYAINRDLSLQVFLQPFVAAGDYTDVRKLARPRSFEFIPVASGPDPDFNRKSLRGNVVLRWEYLRGSTLYAVWNMSTLDTSRPGSFSAFRDLGVSFSGDGSHVFMVKTTYWLGR